MSSERAEIFKMDEVIIETPCSRPINIEDT